MSETEQLARLAGDFAGRELAFRAGSRRLVSDVLEKARAVGFFDDELALRQPAALSRVLHELARADAGLATAVLSNACARQLVCQDSPEAKAAPVAFAPFQMPGVTHEALPKFVDGKLTGTACSLLLSSDAAQAVVLAVSATGAAEYFLVALAGARRSERVRTLGLRSCDFRDAHFERMEARSLGAATALHENLRKRFSAGSAAIALALAVGSLDEALQYSQARRQGGRELFGWSEIRSQLSNMKSQLETARLAFETLADNAGAAEAVALHLQQLACSLASDGMQIMGGAGYTTEFRQEERLRDAFHTQHLLGHLGVRRLRLAAQR